MKDTIKSLQEELQLLRQYPPVPKHRVAEIEDKMERIRKNMRFKNAHKRLIGRE